MVASKDGEGIKMTFFRSGFLIGVELRVKGVWHMIYPRLSIRRLFTTRNRPKPRISMDSPRLSASVIALAILLRIRQPFVG